MRVLLVDDSRTSRAVHRRALESAGYLVVTAEDGVDALFRLMTDASISLVVTDLEMPEMDGLTLVDAIRAHVRRSLPIVVLTSNTNELDRRRVADAGASAFIVKRGRSWRVLLQTVQRLLGAAEPAPAV